MNWKRIILWTITVIVVLVVGVLLTAVLLLQHSSSFRGKILAKVEQSVYQSSGAHLQVRDFGLHLSNLSLDIYGVVVHGTEPQGASPLLTADHLNVGITIDSLFQRKYHFREIVLDHPVVRLAVNKTGENNLPKSQEKSSSNTNLFDLGIRRLVLDRGEVYYNDRKTPLNADLRDLQFTAGYDPTQRRYQGHMSYDDGRVQYGHYQPPPHNLDAGFSLTPDRFNLDRADLSVGHSHIILNASVDDYSNNPRVQARYDALLATGEFAIVMNNPSLPAGVVRLNGVLKYDQQPNRPFLETASLWGMLSSPEILVNTTSLRTTVHNLGAKYRLENGNAQIDNLHADILDGHLEGNAALRDISGAGQGRLQATLKGVSLDLLERVAKQDSLREAHLVGNVSADVQASWAKSVKNLIAHSDLTLQAAVGKNPSTPLNGVIHADYSAANSQIALHQSYIRTPQTSITLDGKVSEFSQLQIRVHSNDLHEVESVAANFERASASAPPQPLGLYGTANFNATVSGSLKNPQIKGQLQASNLRVKGSAWKQVRADVNANPSQVTISNGQLQPATQGYLNFRVQTTLRHWSYTPSSPIAVDLTASQLSIADLERMANKTYPVAGTLAMNVSLRGTQLAPTGHGQISLANGKVSGETIQNLNLDFQGTGNAVNTNLVIRMPSGVTQAKGVYYPRTQSYQLQLQGQNIRLEKLQAVKEKNLQLAGGVNLTANGRGTLKNPELLATVEIPTLQVQKQTLQGIKLQTHVQNHVADIALDSNVVQTYVKARGSVGLNAPYMANVRLDTGRITFAPILAIYAPAHVNDVSGQTELHVSVRGPLQEKNRVEAHLQIPVLQGAYKQLQLAAAKPIQLDYQNGVAVLQPTSIQGTDTNIELQAHVPVNNIKAAAFLVKGNVDLQIAQLVDPSLESTGQLQFDIDSRRYAAGSNLNGQVRIVNAAVHSLDSPVGLDHANGVISVTRDRIEISSFQGQVGGGTVTARGGMAYRPALQFDLGMSANQIRLRYPEGLRTVLKSNLALSGNTQNALVSGQVLVEHISFTPDFDLSTFTSQFGNANGSAGPSTGFTQNVKLNIAVQSTSQVQLQSSQVSVSGNANLRVAGTAAEPVILGRTTLTGGELFFGGNRYVLQSGTIDFLNPVRTQPVVNVQAKTTIDQYNIAMNVRGPIERLHTEYTSDPALPPADIINLIATGKTTEAAAATPSSGFTSGAESLLAQGVSSKATSKISQAAGISHLSVDPALGGNGTDPGARISIQQRVTSNFYVTFATDVTSTQRQAVQLEYKFNRRWSATTVRDQNGGFGVNGLYKKDF